MSKSLCLFLCAIHALPAAELKKASSHPMNYYLSLPAGWTAQKKWPVVMVIESANRDFANAAAVYEKARGDMPFILVTPTVTTNGGPNYRQAPGYSYSGAEWNRIEQLGRCQFDLDGLAAVASDVQRQFGGESKYYLTGLEAAGHTIWTVMFRNPEALRAVAPVATNYAGRCMEDGKFAAAVPDLPVRVFKGEGDEGMRGGTPFASQTVRATDAAREHGYRNFSVQAVPGKGHEPLAGEVLAYFYSLWKQ